MAPLFNSKPPPPHRDLKLIAEYRKVDEKRGRTLDYAYWKQKYQIFCGVAGAYIGFCYGMSGRRGIAVPGALEANAGHGVLVASGWAMLGVCFANGSSHKLFPRTDVADVEDAKDHFYGWLSEKEK